MREIDTFVAVAEAERLLLLYMLEALAAPRRRSVKQRGVDGSLDRLEDERALRSAIDLYASLKDSDHSSRARDPPRPVAP